MMGRSHMASGALTGSAAVAIVGVTDQATVAAFVGTVTLSALLPDFDHPSARGPRAFGLAGRLLAHLVAAVSGGHRGLTHSLLGLAMAGVLLGPLPALTPAPWWFPLAVLLGCATHIAGDMLTVSGVPLMWPNERDYRLARLRTGSLIETAVLCPLMTAGATVLVTVAVL